MPTTTDEPSRKSITVNFRISGEDDTLARTAAWRARLSFAEFLRQAIRREAQRIARQHERAAEEERQREREAARQEVLAELGIEEAAAS